MLVFLILICNQNANKNRKISFKKTLQKRKNKLNFYYACIVFLIFIGYLWGLIISKNTSYEYISLHQ